MWKAIAAPYRDLKDTKAAWSSFYIDEKKMKIYSVHHMYQKGEKRLIAKWRNQWHENTAKLSARGLEFI